MEDLLVRKWIKQVIGKDEYIRLVVNDSDLTGESIDSHDINCYMDEQSVKKSIKTTFSFIITGRVHLHIQTFGEIVSYTLFYDTRYATDVADYAIKYLKNRGFLTRYGCDQDLDNHYFRYNISRARFLTFLNKQEKSQEYDLWEIINTREFEEIVDKEFSKVYEMFPFTRRRMNCRKAVIYFMIAFKKIFPKDICKMIGKQIYFQSKNNHCWDSKIKLNKRLTWD